MSEIKVSMNPVSNDLLDKVVGGNLIEFPENLTGKNLCPNCGNYVTPVIDANGILCCPVCWSSTGICMGT